MLHEMLAVAFKRAPCGLLLTDQRGAILLANDAAATLFGYTLDELARTPVDALIPDRLQGLHAEQRAGYYAAPDERQMGSGRDLVGRHRSGEEIPLEVGLSPIRHEGEVFVLCSVVDISRRLTAERAQAKLESEAWQNQKLESLGILASGVAHDFGSLLMSLSGTADLALTELPEGSPVSARLEAIREVCGRMSQLTAQMLAFAGHGSQALVPVDVNAVIREAAEPLEVATHHRAAVQLALDPELPQILGDASSVRQLLLNLVHNAVEALDRREAGIVSIETELRDDPGEDLETKLEFGELSGPCVVVTVTDTGSGISEETLARMFDPFFSTKEKSSGLGLAAVRGIVTRHQGLLRVASKLGEGTTFRALFPASARPTTDPTPTTYLG